MEQSLFAEVDEYIESLFVRDDTAMDAALEAADAAGLPQIQVSASQGKFLYLLAKLIGAQRILELGTLGGFSTIWMARALPVGGKLISLEFSSKHADVARANIAHAGLSDRVDIVVGAALETLPKLVERGEEPFDMVFIDADKGNYSAYLEWTLKLTRPGSLIVADNVVCAGAVLDPKSTDESAQGVRAFNAALAKEPRVEAVVLQVVGVKEHDGLAFARVKG